CAPPPRRAPPRRARRPPHRARPPLPPAPSPSSPVPRPRPRRRSTTAPAASASWRSTIERRRAPLLRARRRGAAPRRPRRRPRRSPRPPGPPARQDRPLRRGPRQAAPRRPLAPGAALALLGDAQHHRRDVVDAAVRQRRADDRVGALLDRAGLRVGEQLLED